MQLDEAFLFFLTICDFPFGFPPRMEVLYEVDMSSLINGNAELSFY